MVPSGRSWGRGEGITTRGEGARRREGDGRREGEGKRRGERDEGRGERGMGKAREGRKAGLARVSLV